MNRVLPYVVVALLLGATPLAGQIAGRYAFEAPTPDVTIPGELEINGTAPAYGGWVRWTSPAGRDSAMISRVTPEASNLTVVAENPAGRYTLRLTFASDSFTGSYEGPQSGPMHGRRMLLDPVGVYDFMAGPAEGNEQGGRLVIRGSHGAYTGTIAPDGDEPGPITSLQVRGSDLEIVAAGGSVTVNLRLTARGDSLVGTYEVSNGQAGRFRSVRIRR
jgi:hypothetical protein